jgi:hypothetical protein
VRKISIAVALVALVALVAGPATATGKTGSACSPAAPRASIDNSYAWAAKGSWGLPGQQLKYAINVFNNDSGCGSSTFGVSVSAADGFAVSVPLTVTVNSASSTYVWANVTSPAGASDGDYPLSVTVQRASASSPAAASVYKVYTSDTASPKLYWMNPSDGGALSGRSAYVGFASSDDHAVRQLRVFVDGALVATKVCDNISYECQLSYKWAIRRVHGQHTASFESTDWTGNVGTYSASFSVN